LVSGDKKVNLPVLQCHGKTNRKRYSKRFFFSVQVIKIQWYNYVGLILLNKVSEPWVSRNMHSKNIVVWVIHLVIK